MTSLQVTFSEVLRHKLVQKCQQEGPSGKIIAIGWMIAPESMILSSYEKAGRHWEKMSL